MFKSRSEGNVVYKCTVRLLEDLDVLECEFQPHHKGCFLLDYVCEQLEITEKDYFGLRFVDSAKQRHWLDLAKTIIKQVKDVDPLVLSFRVKFYPADPLRLTNNGKLMLYQQLKRDLRHGRLYCSAGEAAALGALIVQDELGDYDAEAHTGEYVSSLKIALRQSDQLEKKAMELHQKRDPGQEAVAVYDEFVGIARSLETYGIDPHPVKDHRGTQLYLGINFSGISTFAAGRRTQHFRWPEVHKINFEGKMFIIHLAYSEDRREVKKHTVGFKCPSGAACRYVWRCSIEQMLFFTLPTSQHASVVSGGGFFSWGTKFRYSGRTERELMSEALQALRQQKLNNTSPSKRKAQSVPATPSSPQGDLAEIRYSSLPRSTMSEPLGGCGDHLASSVYCTDNPLPTLETVSEEARKTNGESNDHLSDYYFRDSFDHSSSESGFTAAANSAANPLGDHHHHPHHRTHHPHHLHHHHRQAYTTDNIPALAMHHSVTNHAASIIQQQNASNSAKNAKKFSLLQAFVPSFLFVVVVLIVSAIYILETDTELFAPLRNWPEMICLRYQYYQPLKEFLAKKFGAIF
ncbi:FERM domain-containing protein 5 isoform X2 [Anopheles arabiensis]|uniref:Moesin/ezrin/radixin homolog 1 n=1 Tax=Anopheles coluzzii TaxID=1518534 RepID=A0A6E8VY24_ANOCL|nr:FERM domain-containing protein 5 isoform X2 [Anopheles arabiensis]XP_040235619.1 FERM domain-containing protein 5 isoform X2 [Anopheles coluzzii]XP_314937.5 FERM domain-containing protein 5 isoform X2 [Anopheles gambiae]